MAMTMNGEYELQVPPQTVWEKLNDPTTLKACIPGCEQLDKTSDTEFQAIATVKIGPVKAKFKGKVTLSDLDPPNGYKISGQGEAASLASPRGVRRSGSRRRTAVRCCRTMSMRRSAASWRSSVSGWSTAPPKRSPTTSSRTSPMQ